MKILVTGGCGSIGSNFIRYWLSKYSKDRITNLDKLTYAGHLSSTSDFAKNSNYKFVKADICNQNVVNEVMREVDVVVHFAAETHVDRSIIGPQIFLQTNVLGTQVLLDAALKAKIKLFHYVSTDEVFGSLLLKPKSLKFNEKTPYNPHSPYSASKAASDFLVRAYHTTYGLPITITNTSNNFGPFQEPEKLIPRFIINLLNGQKIPLMGKGENIRDWIYVLDHVRAIDMVIQKALKNSKIIGETFCVGANSEKSNLEITKTLLKLTGNNSQMIQFVGHRLGHDLRYAIDAAKIKKVLGWEPEYKFEIWLEKTVKWYQENSWWWKPLLKENRPVVDRSAQKGYFNNHGKEK
ncbi:MAG: dTDP-glucose 4,6-dehydratase [Candidatus Staskawiczbacteria bacterium]|nr:dTDP-glucose 4,6-dehydratase [Candidatus Staskawiczbacteria bacterium]